MSIYSTVTAHNKQSHGEPIVPEIMYDDPLYKLNLNEKGTTIAGQAIPNEDMSEYYSDDDEREKALQKEKLNAMEKEK